MFPGNEELHLLIFRSDFLHDRLYSIGSQIFLKTMCRMNPSLCLLYRYLYIADNGNGRIMKWTGNDLAGGKCVVGCTNTSGSASNQLNGPRDLKFDRHGNLYVSDQGNHRIQKFMLNGSSTTC